MEFLEQVELFEGIGPGIMAEIAGYARETVFRAGEILFRKGDFAQDLYLLVDGEIELTVEGRRPITFTIQKPGEVVGWSALVEPHRYTARAESTRETTVVGLPGDRLMKTFQEHPSEALTVMKRLAKVIASRPIGKFSLRYESNDTGGSEST